MRSLHHTTLISATGIIASFPSCFSTPSNPQNTLNPLPLRTKIRDRNHFAFGGAVNYTDTKPTAAATKIRIKNLSKARLNMYWLMIIEPISIRTESLRACFPIRSRYDDGSIIICAPGFLYLNNSGSALFRSFFPPIHSNCVWLQPCLGLVWQSSELCDAIELAQSNGFPINARVRHTSIRPSSLRVRARSFRSQKIANERENGH